MQRLRHVLRIGALVHVALGPLVVLLVMLSPPWVIGEGRVVEALHHAEDLDWRWWALVVFVILWGAPVVAVAGWMQARKAGLETEKVRQRIEGMLSDRQLPIVVDVDARVPVQVEAPLRIPIELDTRLAFDELVDIETSVPLQVELPLDTVVETSVFGLGVLKVPIRARIPVDLVVPIKGKIRIKTDALPVRLDDECIAHLPTFEVPIRSRFETKLALLDNLRTAGKELRKGVSEVLSGLDAEKR